MMNYLTRLQGKFWRLSDANAVQFHRVISDDPDAPYDKIFDLKRDI
jgi:hypothetical protein